ncbi:MAG: aspartate kinase [Candidatus Hodarchaeota archaeon]
MNLTIMRFGRNCLTDINVYNKMLEIINQYKDSKLVFVIPALPEITELLEESTLKSERGEDVSSILQTIKNKHNQVIHSIFSEYQIHLLDEFLQDNLEKIKEKLEDIKEFGISSYKTNFVISFGELFSTYILSNFLLNNDCNVEYISANFIVLGEDNLPIMDVTTRKIQETIIPLLEKNTIPIISGSIGRNKEGHITTLGPGGNDLTATIIADALQGEQYRVKIIFWETIAGILTADTKIEPSAKLIENLSYEEAKEISYYGVKVLHPSCIQHIHHKEIPLEIRDITDLTEEKFTKITKYGDKKSTVKGIAYIDEVAMISAISEALVEVPGTVAKLFGLMGENKINVTLISQSSSEVNTTFVVDKKECKRAIKIIKDNDFFRKWFEVKSDIVAEIAIIGEGLGKPGILGKVFSALGEKKIDVLAISQASGGLNISVLVPKDQLKNSIKAIHQCFL